MPVYARRFAAHPITLPDGEVNELDLHVCANLSDPARWQGETCLLYETPQHNRERDDGSLAAGIYLSSRSRSTLSSTD